MRRHRYIACDLGAESGRVMLGTLDGDKLTVEEIHRFTNGGILVGGSLRWDVLRLFDELKTGLAKVAARGLSVESVSCDSWGVDYVLLQGDEPFLAAPYHYRDKRTQGALQRAFAVVPAERIFEETGIQFMAINTLYQLIEDLKGRPSILSSAERFLNIGDYFNYLFCGVAKAEESLASTTQLFNPRRRTWSDFLIRNFGLPSGIFPEIVPSGTILGEMRPGVCHETGLQRCRVVAGCSHDTAAAVAAVPREDEQWAYLSSGTWSLLGIETSEPVINAKSLEYEFTNEMGFGGTIRLLKNIYGLWIVQECRRSWAKKGEEYSYTQLTQMAEAATSPGVFLDLNDPLFLNPDDMLTAIAQHCRALKKNNPGTPGEVIRCVLESLAVFYRTKLEQLEEIAGRKLTAIHIVGGGSKNNLLNQLTCSAIGRPVLAGPVECAAIGNILIQAVALGHVSSIKEVRSIVRRSFPVVRYEPFHEFAYLQTSSLHTSLS